MASRACLEDSNLARQPTAEPERPPGWDGKERRKERDSEAAAIERFRAISYDAAFQAIADFLGDDEDDEGEDDDNDEDDYGASDDRRAPGAGRGIGGQRRGAPTGAPKARPRKTQRKATRPSGGDFFSNLFGGSKT